ncbi:MAG: hypothetical protein WAU32_11650 [Thermoanaerobaculia bacterium]
MTLTGVGRVSAQQARRLVQVAGLIFYVLAAQGLLAAGVGAHVYFQGGSVQDLLLPATGALLAACYAVVGFYLRRYRLWARNFAFAFAAISLFFFPVGTVLGASIVLCIDRANRAKVFPQRLHAAPAAALAAAAEENAPLLHFDPLVVPSEQTG